MAEENKKLKPLDQLRKEADEKINKFQIKKTGRLGNIKHALETDRMTQEQADRDVTLLEKEEQEHLDYKASLYEGHLPNNFNEKSNPPVGVGAATPWQIEQERIKREVEEKRKKELAEAKEASRKELTEDFGEKAAETLEQRKENSQKEFEHDMDNPQSVNKQDLDHEEIEQEPNFKEKDSPSLNKSDHEKE